MTVKTKVRDYVDLERFGPSGVKPHLLRVSHHECSVTLELEPESHLQYPGIVLLLGKDAEVGRVQAVARALAVAGAFKADIIEHVKCVGPELEMLMFRPRQDEILE